MKEANPAGRKTETATQTAMQVSISTGQFMVTSKQLINCFLSLTLMQINSYNSFHVYLKILLGGSSK